jgi:hypothetical protein
MYTGRKLYHTQITTLAANRNEGDGLAGIGQGLTSDPAHRSKVGCLPSNALSTPMTWSNVAGDLTPAPSFSCPAYNIAEISIPHFDTKETLEAASLSRMCVTDCTSDFPCSLMRNVF